MPPVRKPDDDVDQRLAAVETKLDALLDAFKDVEENRNRSVRETLGKVKLIARGDDPEPEDDPEPGLEPEDDAPDEE